MKNLLGRLMGRSFEELKQIAAAWQVPLNNQNHNDLAIAVYREMGDKSATRSVWVLMTPAAREFARWLLAQRNFSARIEEIPAALDSPMAAIQPALDEVTGLGLADVEEALMRGNRVVSAGDNLYNWGARNLDPPSKKTIVSVSNEVSRTLGAVLEELDSNDPFDASLVVLLDRMEQPALEKIANKWNLPDLRYMSKTSLVEMLDSLLDTRQVREQTLKDLPEEAQRLFELIVASGGRIDAEEAASQLACSSRELRRRFVALENCALAFETLWQNRRFLFAPRQVLDPGHTEQEQQPTIEIVAAPHNIDTHAPIELPWDLLTMLAYFKQNEVAPNLHNGELPRRALKRITESFVHPIDPAAAAGYLRLLQHFAELMGLTHEEEETRRIMPEARLEEWVRLPFAVQSMSLFQRWLDDRRLREDPSQPFYIWRTPDPTAARKRLIKELAACPLDTWLSINSLLEFIQKTDPHVLYSKDEVLRHGGVPALREFDTNWMKNEGALLRSMLTGALYWFGVIELGGASGEATSFRVTGSGARLIDHPAKTAEPVNEQKPFLVQPNFEVLVLAPESRPLWTLLLCSDLVRHDRVSVYSINKESILRARADGFTATQLHDFLKANSNKQAPQNVVQCISDWSRGYKRALVQKATLLEVEEPELLDELLASRRLRGYVVRRLSSTIAMLSLPRTGPWSRDDPWQKLAKELRSAGYFPEVAEEPRAAEKPKANPTTRPEQPDPAQPRDPAVATTTNGPRTRSSLVPRTSRPTRKGRFPAA